VFAEKLPTMHLYPIDGAVHDIGAGETPFSYREANWAEVIVGVDPDPANADVIRDWTIDYWEATHLYSTASANEKASSAAVAANLSRRVGCDA
jgi:hypothetical protein